jgi:hypothetical protein
VRKHLPIDSTRWSEAEATLLTHIQGSAPKRGPPCKGMLRISWWQVQAGRGSLSVTAPRSRACTRTKSGQRSDQVQNAAPTIICCMVPAMARASRRRKQVRLHSGAARDCKRMTACARGRDMHVSLAKIPRHRSETLGAHHAGASGSRLDYLMLVPSFVCTVLAIWQLDRMETKVRSAHSVPSRILHTRVQKW